MGLQVYWDPRSPPCRAVVLFMRMAGIPHYENFVDLAKGEQMQEEFRKLTAVGQVPVVENNGFVLTESTVILQFACQKMTLGDHWFPKMPVKRARIQEYLMWHESNGFGKTELFATLVVVPFRTGAPVNEVKLQEDCAKLENQLNILEKYFLKRSQFLATDEISIADIMAYSSLTQNRALNYPVGRNRPLVTAWLAKVDAKVAPHAEEVNQMIMAMCQPFMRDFETMKLLHEPVETPKQEAAAESAAKVGDDKDDEVAASGVILYENVVLKGEEEPSDIQENEEMKEDEATSNIYENDEIQGDGAPSTEEQEGQQEPT